MVGKTHKENMEALKVDYWDVDEACQKQRDMTPAEIAQREIDIAAAAVPVVPQEVPMLNARLALIDDGHLAAVEAYADAMPGIEGEKARAFLKHAQTVRRDHYLVEVMRVLRELTHAQVDSLFIRAAAIG
jgi:hypothetical protein